MTRKAPPSERPHVSEEESGDKTVALMEKFTALTRQLLSVSNAKLQQEIKRHKEKKPGRNARGK